MKTTQEKAVTAFGTLNRMAQKPMNSFTAYKLFKLKKSLKDAVEFQIEQEQKLAEELGGSITEGQLMLDKEKQKEFYEKRKELNAMECEIDRGKTEIFLAELKDITLAEMEALEDFIVWKEN